MESMQVHKFTQPQCNYKPKLSHLYTLTHTYIHSVPSRSGCMCRQGNMHRLQRRHTLKQAARQMCAYFALQPTFSRSRCRLDSLSVSPVFFSLTPCLSPSPLLGCGVSLVLLQLPHMPMWFVWHSRN